MRNKFLWVWLVATPLVALPLLAFAQASHHQRTLIINGQSGEAPVIESDGHTYIDLETLARIGNGSVAFQGDRIVLSLPALPAAQPAGSAFSKEFMKAAIEELSVVREWRNSLRNAIERSYPITDDWVSAYRTQAADGLRRASVEVTTDADRSALQSLTNEFNNMDSLANKYLNTSNAREYIRPDALRDDAAYQRILTCARSLSSMISTGQFVDDASCS